MGIYSTCTHTTHARTPTHVHIYYVQVRVEEALAQEPSSEARVSPTGIDSITQLPEGMSPFGVRLRPPSSTASFQTCENTLQSKAGPGSTPGSASTGGDAANAEAINPFGVRLKRVAAPETHVTHSLWGVQHQAGVVDAGVDVASSAAEALIRKMAAEEMGLDVLRLLHKDRQTAAPPGAGCEAMAGQVSAPMEAGVAGSCLASGASGSGYTGDGAGLDDLFGPMALTATSGLASGPSQTDVSQSQSLDDLFGDSATTGHVPSIVGENQEACRHDVGTRSAGPDLLSDLL